MCGLIFSSFPQDDKSAREARESARRRGPDGSSVAALPNGGFIEHHALRTTGGSFQPFEINRGARRIVWAVNGQFYGWKETRRNLEEKGACFESDCDSEVLGWLWVLEGEHGLRRLEGEFAWLLFDSDGDRVLMGRDENGCRPLYWSESEKGVVASSDLFGTANMARKSDADPVFFAESFFMQYPPEERTAVKGVSRIPPGTIIEFSKGRRRRTFPHPLPERGSTQKDSSAKGIEEALRLATRLRLPEGRLGTHLSSGLDGAAVCALAQEAGASPEAWTVDFGPEGEIEGTRASARLLGVDLTEFEYSARKGLDDLIFATRRSGCAFMDAHVAAKARMSDEMAKSGLRVFLSGEGSDEAFMGYEFCLAEAGIVSSEFSMGGVHSSEGVAVPSWDNRFGYAPKWVQAKTALSSPLSALISETLRVGSDSEAAARLTGALFYDERQGRPRGATEAWRRRVMSGYILPAVDDGASSAAGIESRMPFLDSALRAAALGAKDAEHFRGGRGKALLREALRGVLPDEIRERPKRPFVGDSVSRILSSDARQMKKARETLGDAGWDDWVDTKKALEFLDVCAKNGGKVNDARIWLLLSNATLARLAGGGR